MFGNEEIPSTASIPPKQKVAVQVPADDTSVLTDGIPTPKALQDEISTPTLPPIEFFVPEAECPTLFRK